MRLGHGIVKRATGAMMIRPYGPRSAPGLGTESMSSLPPDGSSAGADGKANRVEQLVLPHLDAAYNLVRWLARSEQDAADIVHEAFLRAVRYADSYQGGNARAWWLAIVRSTYLTWIS